MPKPYIVPRRIGNYVQDELWKNDPFSISAHNANLVCETEALDRIKVNHIYNEDNIVTLNRMTDDYLDLTVTSPPYNVDLGNNKYNKNPYDLYNDNQEHRQYLQWLQNVLTLVYRKTKYSGRCVINIGDPQNGRIPSHSDIIQLMSEIGWIPMTTLIWDKSNASSRTSWGSFQSPSSPSFPTPFEFILPFAKGDRKLKSRGETDLTKEEFIQWSLARWTFGTESPKRIGHPAPFPVELPTRCLKMFSWRDAIVYDPFMGSGTTAIACIQTHRSYIGSEISDMYCALAQERIKKEIVMDRKGK